jgi:hypothetical protein
MKQQDRVNHYDKVEVRSSAEARTCVRTALTQLNGHSQRCANLFCVINVEIKSPRGKHGRYCCARCRFDGYALRRAKALLDKVGVVRFHVLLDET